MKKGDIVLPPFGRMTDTHLAAMQKNLVPSDWRVPAGSTQSAEAHYKEFLKQALGLIKQTLWPEYTASGWSGDTITTMVPLTRLDLGLMLQSQQDGLFDHSIAPADKRVTRTHKELFAREDAGEESFGAHYGDYDPDASLDLTERMRKLGDVGLRRKVANGPLLLKQALQRPRPYQTSLLLAVNSFRYQEAITATTPSIFSGHCLQGTLCIGYILEELLNADTTITGQMLQYTVDIGDRRVLAGVHYPSDNLASWMIALMSAPFVFRNSGVKPLLWKAITKFSLVYPRIRDANDHLYAPALQALKEIASDSV